MLDYFTTKKTHATFRVVSYLPFRLLLPLYVAQWSEGCIDHMYMHWSSLVNLLIPKVIKSWFSCNIAITICPLTITFFSATSKPPCFYNSLKALASAKNKIKSYCSSCACDFYLFMVSFGDVILWEFLSLEISFWKNKTWLAKYLQEISLFLNLPLVLFSKFFN